MSCILDALSDVSDSSQDLVDHLDDLDQDDIVELARKEADAPRPCAPPPPCRDPALAVDRALSVARTLPWGPERKKLTHKLKLHKVMNVKAVAVAQRERIAVATVWNHSSLSRGERLNVKNGVLKRSRDKELRAKWQHARAWTLQGALKVAFSCIGQMCPKAAGLRKTRREVDAIAGAALAHRHWVHEQGQCTKLHVQSGTLRMQWLMVERALDATPIKIGFGSMHPHLAPISRYWWRDAVKPIAVGGTKAKSDDALRGNDDPSWVVIDYDEYKRRCKGREPKCGTVELLAQTLRCSWMTVSDTGRPIVHAESPIIEPLYLARTNASTLLNALERASPFASLSSLMELSKHVPRICLLVAGDLCSSNGRMKQAIAYKLAMHNAVSVESGGGVILMIDIHCSSHIVHRIVEKIFSLHQFIPRMHAIAFTLSAQSMFSMVLRSLRSIVEHDLRLGFYPDTQPPPDMQEANKTLVELTVLRFKVTRSRDDNVDETARDLRSADVAAALQLTLNGDWCRPQLQHYCWQPGCCENRSRQVAIEKIYSILVAAFFDPMSSYIPSTSRWHTFGPTLAVQAGGLLCHSILQRAVQILDPEVQDYGEVDQDDGVDSWKVHVNKKLKACLRTLGDQAATLQTWSLGLFATEAIDHLSALLQHCDATGFALRELVSPNGALHAFQVHTWSLLNPWSGELKHSQKLSTLLAHLARSLGDGFDKQACYNEFRGFTLAVGSAVWSRLQLKYWSWPFLVLRGIQPVAPTADAAAVLHEFWEAPACCLDSAWGLWFRASLASEDELSSMDVQMWLREIERKAPSTNMLLEGLLAEVKAACPRPTASGANAEKFSYLGVLTQLMHKHLKAGKHDARSTTFTDAKRAGVPLDIPRSESMHTRSGRHDAAYVMTRQHTFMKGNPSATVEQRGAERSRLFAEWAALGPEQQRAFAETRGGTPGVELEDTSECDESNTLMSWDPGNRDWPVSPQALQLLQETCPSSHADGLANKMHKLRWAMCDRFVVKDEGLIQEHEVFKSCLSCSETHPGLCRTRDAKDLDRCLTLASVIERFFGQDELHSFWRLLPPGVERLADPTLSFNFDLVVYFAHRRARRMHAPVSHVWVRCQYLSDGEYAFQQAVPSCFNYLTAWTLAKLLIRNFGPTSEGESYAIQPLRCQDNLDNKGAAFKLHADLPARPLAHPIRQRAVAARVSELDKLTDKPKRRRKQVHIPRLILSAPVPKVRAGPMPPAAGDGADLRPDSDDGSDRDTDWESFCDDDDDGPGQGPPDRPPPPLQATDWGLPDDAPASVRAALLGKKNDDLLPLHEEGAAASSASASASSGPARARNEVKVTTGTGYIVKNVSGQSLDAHCELCGLRANRKFTVFLNAKSPKTLAQGRPLGFLVALLDFRCNGNMEEHRAYATDLSHESRVCARLGAEAQPLFCQLFACEREARDEEEFGEPSAVP